VGLGTVQVGYNPYIEYDQALAIIQSAYDAGIRYFDTAPMSEKPEADSRTRALPYWASALMRT